jgi:hypothetical protein
MIDDLAAAAVGEILQIERAAVPDVRAIRRRLTARLKQESGPDAAAVGLAIASSPSLKPVHARWVGWELIQHHGAALASLDLAKVEALGAGLSSWDEVDGFALAVAGPAWRCGTLADADVVAWAHSPDLWRRRMALAATVALNSRSHGGAGDAARTLLIADLLAADREDMVVKALSWALRKLIAWDRAAVETFLERYEAVLAARVRREVGAKLRTGHKTPSRRPHR